MDRGVEVRRFEALDAVVELSVDVGLAEVLDFVLRDLPSSDDVPTVKLSVTAVGQDRFEFAGDTAWVGEVDLEDVFPRLITVLNNFALASVRDELCVHGGGAVLDGRLHALVAQSGVGKTTLLTALMQLGVAGLNDELLRVRRDGRSARSWRKPLSLKPGTIRLFPHLAAIVRDEGRGFRHVPLSAVGEIATGSFDVGSVMILHRSGGDERIVPITPAVALSALVANTMNFDAVGADTALSTLSGMVAEAPCYRVDVGDPTGTASVVAAEARRARPRSVTFELMTDRAEFMTEGVRTIRLGGEVVVWSPLSRQVIALDQVGSTVWLEACEGRIEPLLSQDEFLKALYDRGMLDLERTREARRRTGEGRL